MHPVNEAYESYRKNPTDSNYKALYEGMRAYARRLGALLLSGLPNSRYFHACENAATNALMNLEHFDPQRASFSTWAYQSICGDIKDWKRKLDRRTQLGEEYAALPKPRRLIWKEDIWIAEVLSRLTESERKLVQLKLEGASLNETASQLAVSTATVKRRWTTVIAKMRIKARERLTDFPEETK
jgi:RNA polymerase sigma factor (sigma-70 family)